MDFNDYRIYFYNNYHNGDVFYSKEFVRDIKNKIGIDHYYIHRNNTSILKDFDIKQINGNTPNNNLTISYNNNKDLFINTWIGQNSKYLIYDCSLKSNYLLYTDIYNKLNIDIEPIGYYIPDIDFDAINKSKIDNFNFKDSVLICNNYVFSGQATNFNFDPIVNKLSDIFKDKLFILTNNNTNLVKDNVLLAGSIIGYESNNLLDISYMSTKINTIIGRGSGPFCFSHIKQNMSDKDKKFISFTNSENEGKWVPDSESTAKQYWSNNFNIDSVINFIKNNINN
jgi:hypothetical protein